MTNQPISPLDRRIILDGLRRPINAVWQEIGSESMQLAAEMGERISNASAIESCVDAGRLATCYIMRPDERKAASELFNSMHQKYGSALLRLLSRNIQLV